VSGRLTNCFYWSRLVGRRFATRSSTLTAADKCLISSQRRSTFFDQIDQFLYRRISVIRFGSGT
jgi:hypothetical protein